LRSDLLRILSPIQKAPSFELLNAGLKVYPELGGRDAHGDQTYSDNPKNLTWKLYMEFYVASRADAHVVIPFHHCGASFEIPRHIPRTQFESIVIEPLSSLYHRGGRVTMRIDSVTIENTKYEVLINGPGKIMLQGEVDLPKVEISREEDVRIQVALLPVDSEYALSFCETLHKVPPNEQRHEFACWSLK
jgi:hypothetical protein